VGGSAPPSARSPRTGRGKIRIIWNPLFRGSDTCKNRPQVAAAGGEFVDDHLSLTQALLTEAEAAYQAKATALTGVKAKLTRAKNDMAHATLEEQRAARSPA
jgi:hypothetical protein